MKASHQHRPIKTGFSSPLRLNGDQTLNGYGQRPKFVSPSDNLNGVRTKLGGDIYESLEDEELEFCIASLSAIWGLINRHTQSQSPGQSRAGQDMNVKPHKFIENLERVMEKHHGNEELTMTQLADYMAMSVRHLQRKLKALTDQQPSGYLRLYRLNRSLALLQQGRRVSEVAYAVGFRSPAYFASCFRAKYGCTPTEYQAKREQTGSA